MEETAGKIWSNRQGQHNFVHGHPMEIWVRRMHTCGEGTSLNILGIDMNRYISWKKWHGFHDSIGLLLAECSMPSRQLFRRFGSTVDLPFTFLRGCLEPGLVTYLLKVWNSHWHLNEEIALEHALFVFLFELFDALLVSARLLWVVVLSCTCMCGKLLATILATKDSCVRSLVRADVEELCPEAYRGHKAALRLQFLLVSCLSSWPLFLETSFPAIKDNTDDMSLINVFI